MKYMAVIGSRGYNNYEEFMNYINHYTQNLVAKDLTFVSGGASSGADALIARFCKEHGLRIIEHKADWNKYGRSAGPRRNIDIVNRADMLLAFWDGESRGSKHSIDLARKKGIPVKIVKIKI